MSIRMPYNLRSYLSDHDLVDKLLLNNKASFKHESLYNRPFDIIHFWTKSTVTLQMSVIKIKYNMRFINIFISDKKC